MIRNMPNTLQPEDKPLSNSEQSPVVSNDSHVENQKEYGGPKGKEPTRYGDWEKKGRCIDF
ncbi:MAG: hypothetical protein ACI9VI_003101 [Candidatus Azotimanducaceae bacterium]|jgi:hypothetical protein